MAQVRPVANQGAAQVAVRESRPSGPADNVAFYHHWLRTDPLFDTLFMSAVNINPFNGSYDDNNVPTMAYLAWYGHHRVLSPNKMINRSNVLVASWADLMGPYIATERIASEENSRNMLIQAVRALLSDDMLNSVSDASRATYNTATNNQGGAVWDTFTAADAHGATPQNAMLILKHLANRAGVAFRMGGVSMIVHVYIAILKQGNVSELFIDKINTGMMNELQINNIRIDPEACKIFFNVFGQKINDENIAAITTHWREMLPASALRLRLTVMQAAGSGLTALSITGRAIKTYVDFNWGRIRMLYPDEWASLVDAVRAVGHNVWYGFKKELGVVKSTKYKNISYVAKEILIKINGEASLRTYAGWTRRAKFQAVVDELIAVYERTKTASIQTGEAMPPIPVVEEVIDLRNMIIDGGDVFA